MRTVLGTFVNKSCTFVHWQIVNVTNEQTIVSVCSMHINISSYLVLNTGKLAINQIAIQTITHVPTL